MAALPQSAPSYEGIVKTFGPSGPAYEVIGDAGISPQGRPLVAIRVVRTGETLDYEVDDMLSDPEAA